MPEKTTTKIAASTKAKSLQMKNLLGKKKYAKLDKGLPKVGDLVEAKVISLGKNEVYLDIDGLATGVVRGPELYDESEEFSDLKVGDTVSATVIDLENEKGQLELSFRSAGHQKVWKRLTGYLEKEETIPVKIIDANKGGLMAKLGQVVGFIPVSQLSVEHYPRVEGGDRDKILEKLKTFINQTLKVKVITADERENKLIFSEKGALIEKSGEQRQYKVGDIVEGVVSAVTDFGAFIRLASGLEGLVHISELAWQRIDNPRDIIKKGDKVKAEIIDIDHTKISLSIKRLKEDPWKKVAKKYRVGQIVEGKVIKVNPFGLFVELDKDIHALAHISELSSKLVRNPREIARIGDKLRFKIVSLEPENHRMGLSLKALEKKQVKKESEDEKIRGSKIRN